MKYEIEKMYLVKGKHRIPVSNDITKYFVVDKIYFECPAHRMSYKTEADRLAFNPVRYTSGPNEGKTVHGHMAYFFAHVGKTYEYEIRNSYIVIPIVGYRINGTTITIKSEKDIVISCSEVYEYAEELYQETGELFYRPRSNYENINLGKKIVSTVQQIG